MWGAEPCKQGMQTRHKWPDKVVIFKLLLITTLSLKKQGSRHRVVQSIGHVTYGFSYLALKHTHTYKWHSIANLKITQQADCISLRTLSVLLNCLCEISTGVLLAIRCLFCFVLCLCSFFGLFWKKHVYLQSARPQHIYSLTVLTKLQWCYTVNFFKAKAGERRTHWACVDFKWKCFVNFCMNGCF